jgi:hypothetical protein
MPTIGYVMAKDGNGITLSDVAYTRPRQQPCVFYPAPLPLCPTQQSKAAVTDASAVYEKQKASQK